MTLFANVLDIRLGEPAGRGHPELRGDFIRQPAVYIMANFRNATLYVSATSDLVRRTYLHREGLLDGFTKKYGCKKLVYYEQHTTMPLALEREEQIKSGSRKKKLALKEGINPNWSDLYLEII